MEQEQPKTRGRKPKITVAPRTPETLDVDAIIARRLAGDPRYVRPADVPLRDQAQWYLKEANSYGDANRHYTIVHEEGYLPVTVDDLPDGVTPQSVGWEVSADGLTLCRGINGAERLYKMSKTNRRKIEMAKTTLNKKGTGSVKAVREDMAHAAAAQFGAEAGEAVYSGRGPFGGIQVRPIEGGDTEGPL
jgi:hypothetical protein